MKNFCKITVGVVSLMLLNACIVVRSPPVYYRTAVDTPATLQTEPGQQNTVVANVAPPMPPDEVIGVAPVAGYVWLGGAWFWEGGRHVWHHGYWAEPRVGFLWVPHRWEHVGASWHFRAGHWGRRR
ncbi:MAG: YXWGXW repeat-containing protein [Undibacterium sp.]|nr:YXWGXW repeat-containing protein [Undibacterium sp.]